MYRSNFKEMRGDNTRRFADQNAGFRLRQHAAEENAGGEPGDRPSGRPKDRSCRTADQARKLPPGRAVLLFPLKGLFGQRLWFYGKTAGYTDKLKISEKCVGCGLCVSLCPTKNLSLRDGKAAAESQCTMCYRCISHCPQKAITLLGDEVIEQCQFEKYGSGE